MYLLLYLVQADFRLIDLRLEKSIRYLVEDE